MALSPWLITVACILSAGVWLAGGLYKLAHYDRVVEIIRRHRIPFPAVSYWICVSIELGGTVLLLLQQWLWVTVLIWLGFLVVATPIVHGRLWKDGAIDFHNLLHITKNTSIAGGLIALLALDPSNPFQDWVTCQSSSEICRTVAAQRVSENKCQIQKPRADIACN